MVCQYPSSQIVTVISHPDSGNHYKVPWTLEKDGKDTTIVNLIVQQQLSFSIYGSSKHRFEALYGHKVQITLYDGRMAYKLELPEELSNVHNTFHVSNLKKYLFDESLVIPMKELRLDEKLNFVEEPVEIMDREVKQLKQSRIDGLVDMKHICGTIVAKKKARLGREDKFILVSGYDMEEKAARAYDLAALRYWGPATHINFLLENYEQEVVEMKNMSRQEYVAHLRRRSSGFSRGASVYRGVTRHHQRGRWQARIGRVAGNKDLYLGTFIGSAASDRLVPLSALPHRRGVFWFYSYANSIMGVKVLQLLWDDGNRVILNCFDGEADEAQAFEYALSGCSRLF
ncbi:AP2-like ethylene-responsive transcription factor ANT [Tanacetum coccineum]